MRLFQKTLNYTVLLGFLLFVPSAYGTNKEELKWGGPGYDPSLLQTGASSRFMARYYSNSDSVIEIHVDSFEAQQGVGEIRISDGYSIIVSKKCWKPTNHPKAPSICTFNKDELMVLSGPATIEVWNIKKNVLLERSSVNLLDLLNLE